MNILLTNDDGVGAPGLLALYKHLSAEHEVWVAAPDGNRSGASCALTMDRELAITELQEHWFAIAGTPVDCVIAGLTGGFLPGRPDVVLSGINRGGNLGSDVLYSGTCGAARKAALDGVPGIALSVELTAGETEYRYAALADFAAKNIETLTALCGTLRHINEGEGFARFVNVNAPSLDSYQGIRFASLCSRVYGDSFAITRDTGGRVCAGTLRGTGCVTSLGTEQSDAALVKAGFVAVSVLHTEPSADLDFAQWGAIQFRQ